MVEIDVYQMPERLGGDWAYRIGPPHLLIADGFESEQEALDAARSRLATLANDRHWKWVGEFLNDQEFTADKASPTPRTAR